jgi:2-polyprenyl-3-methyl-5-hydroxy-6-metoxy-1,4-benzoquinol methylase
MACGEGYGSEVLSRSAATVVGVDANPEAHAHAGARYVRENLRFERGLVETYGERGTYDVVVFLQTIEHVLDPTQVLEHFRWLLSPGGRVYVSTPNVLTLAPPGASRSDNPWHLREYRHQEFRSLAESVFNSVELLGLFHARKLRAHALALTLGWDTVHRRLGITSAFYDRFTPAISSRDFVLRADGPLDGALDFLAVCC